MIKWFLLVFMLSALLSCSKSEPTRLTNITGVIPDLTFELTDENGHKVTEKNYLGYTVAIFFGFTSCPDICPTTMHRLSTILNKIDTNASKVKVLFISVDPKRDSLDRLKSYTANFGNAFIGLRGDDGEIKNMAKRYHIALGHGGLDAQGEGEIFHSGVVLVFDKKAKARLLVTQSSSSEDVIFDLNNLVNSIIYRVFVN